MLFLPAARVIKVEWKNTNEITEKLISLRKIVYDIKKTLFVKKREKNQNIKYMNEYDKFSAITQCACGGCLCSWLFELFFQLSSSLLLSRKKSIHKWEKEISSHEWIVHVYCVVDDLNVSRVEAKNYNRTPHRKKGGRVVYSLRGLK